MSNDFFENCSRDDQGRCRAGGGPGGKPGRKPSKQERRRALYEATQYRERDPVPPQVPPRPSASAPSSGAHAEQLAGLVRQLDARNGEHNLISLVALRQALAEAGVTGREQQDHAIQQARKAGLITLSALEGRQGTSEEERAAAVREEGTQLGYVSVRKMLPPSPLRRTKALPQVPPSPFRRGRPPTPRVRLVDAHQVRNRSPDLQEFGNVGTHQQFHAIPPGEVWLSDRVPAGERPYLVAQAQAELQANAAGQNEDASYGFGLTVARAERARRRPARPSHDDVPPDVYVERLGTVTDEDGEQVAVWLVDGELIRDVFKVDFAQGGNGMVYSFTPANEVWIEDQTDPGERDLILLHELTERREMKQERLNYDRAHEAASKIEFQARQRRGTKAAEFFAICERTPEGWCKPAGGGGAGGTRPATPAGRQPPATTRAASAARNVARTSATNTATAPARPAAANAARRQAAKQAWGAVLSGGMKAGAAAKQVARRIGTAAWVKLPPRAQRTLARTWSAAKVIEHKLMIGFHKAQEMVEAVARERGLPAEHAAKVAKIAALVDQSAAWSGASFVAGAAAGGVLGGKLLSYVPVASLAYLSYSTARNPWATLRAAKQLPRKTGGTTARKGLSVHDAEALRDAIVTLLERAGDELFLAAVAAVWDEVHDLGQAVRLAEQALAAEPHGPADEDDLGDDPGEWPGLEEDQGEGQDQDQGDKGLPRWSIKSNVPGVSTAGGPSQDHPMGRNLTKPPDASRYLNVGKLKKPPGGPANKRGQGQPPVYLTGPLRRLQQALGPLADTVNRLPLEVRQRAQRYAAEQLHRFGQEVGPFRSRQLLAAAALLAAAPLPGADPRAAALVEGALKACQLRRDADVRNLKALGISAPSADLAGAVVSILASWYATLGVRPPCLPPGLVEQALALVNEGEDGDQGLSANARRAHQGDGRVVPRGTTYPGQGLRRAVPRGTPHPDQAVRRALYGGVRWPALTVPPSPFRHRKGLGRYLTKDSYFRTCERDRGGRCLPSGAAGGGQAGAAAPAPPEAESPKARRPGAKYVAKLSRFTSPAVKRRIAHALKNEAEFAEAAGGWNVPDSAAFDVIVAVDPGGEFIDKPDRLRSLLRQREDARRRLKADPEGPQAGELQGWLDSHTVVAVEIKTLWTAAADKVRMSPKAVRRKERYAERVGATSATLIFDDRRGRKHSGNRLYLKAGVGTARLDQAEAVEDFSGVLDKLLQGEG
jgi:hypothetical protein